MKTERYYVWFDTCPVKAEPNPSALASCLSSVCIGEHPWLKIGIRI